LITTSWKPADISRLQALLAGAAARVEMFRPRTHNELSLADPYAAIDLGKTCAGRSSRPQ
jgi:hypothetical protein